MIGLEHFLTLSAIIFVIGLYGVLTKRNVIAVLMGIELMFNAVNVAVVAMSKYVVPQALANNPAATGEELVNKVLTGQVFAVMVITVAAAEAALALGIVIAIYRMRQTADVSEISLMKH